MIALSHQRSRHLVLLAFGFTALCAQLSFWVQAHGLVGSEGILPAADLVARVQALPEPVGWFDFPTLLRLGAGDLALHLLCALGVLGALLVILGVAPALGALAVAVATLSQVHVSDAFLSFQWDSLMVEVAVAMALFAPWRLGAGRDSDPEPPPAARWLLAWILFRLMVESGLVKLTWNDPTWADLSAMTYHYQTQPLPHGLSAWAHLLPASLHRDEALATYVMELGVPFLLLLGRWGWRLAAPLMLGLLLVIGATGNYGFFGLLTAVLCLALLDDRALGRKQPPCRRAPWWHQGVALAALVVALVVGGAGVVDAAAGPANDPRTLLAGRGDEDGALVGMQRRARQFASGPLVELAPLRNRLRRLLVVNDYGLFRTMTTTRPEILLEVSDDGEHWQAWPFRFKPDDPARRPPFCQPHMPRLDWRLWFEALRWEWYATRGNEYVTTDWFGATLWSLVDGQPDAVALMGQSPLGGGASAHLRATLVDQRFATPDERASGAGVWVREALDDVGLVLSRDG